MSLYAYNNILVFFSKFRGFQTKWVIPATKKEDLQKDLKIYK